MSVLLCKYCSSCCNKKKERKRKKKENYIDVYVRLDSLAKHRGVVQLFM